MLTSETACLQDGDLVGLGVRRRFTDQLTALGIARWIGVVVSNGLMGLPPLGACVVLAIIYFYSMYIFCSLTGHIIAFVGPFLEARPRRPPSPSAHRPGSRASGANRGAATRCGAVVDANFGQAGKALNAPPFVLLGLLASFSTLCGCLTNYSTGPLIIYFSQVA